MKILLKNATIIDAQSPYHSLSKDILIDSGKLVAIEDTIVSEECTSIERDDLHVSIGWFDSSVSFGEPGYEERETIENGLETAAKSGFTAVVLNPNTAPLLDTHANISHVIKAGSGKTTRLYAKGTLSEGKKGAQMASLYDMHLAGALAFGDYKKGISNPNLMRVALDYVQSFDGLLLSYPMDAALGKNGLMHEGPTSTRLGLNGIPSVAETALLARDLQLLEYTGGKLHIPFISSAKSVDLIQKAKKAGLDVSCGVAISHLHFTDEILEGFDTNYKIFPPIREANDRAALREGLLNGTINMVSTLHEPVNVEYKKIEFNHALDGSIGLEAAFGILNNMFTLEETIDFLTRGRERFNLETPKIIVGAPVNLSLFTPEPEHTMDESALHSTSKNCAFLGESLKGKVYGCIRNEKMTLNEF